MNVESMFKCLFIGDPRPFLKRLFNRKRLTGYFSGKLLNETLSWKGIKSKRATHNQQSSNELRVGLSV